MTLAMEIFDYSCGETLLHCPGSLYLLFNGRVDLRPTADSPPELVGALEWECDAYNVVMFSTEPGLIYTVTRPSSMAKLPIDKIGDLLLAFTKTAQYVSKPVGRSGFAIRGGRNLREAIECVTHASALSDGISSDRQTAPAPPHPALHTQAMVSIPASSPVQGINALLDQESSFDPFPSRNERGTLGAPTFRPTTADGKAA